MPMYKTLLANVRTLYWKLLIRFKAKCWVSGVDGWSGQYPVDTPYTFMTTRASAVLIINVFQGKNRIVEIKIVSDAIKIYL